MCKNIVKYTLIALALGAGLKYTPGIEMENNKIIIILTIIILFVYLLERKNTPYVEKMNAMIVTDDILDIEHDNVGNGENTVEAVVMTEPVQPMCDGPRRFPAPYTFGTLEEDEIAAFNQYDYNTTKYGDFMRFNEPGYYLDNNGEFDNDGLKLEQLPRKICASKMHNLYEQHNHVKWTPHTHIGKARGYANWKSFY